MTRYQRSPRGPRILRVDGAAQTTVDSAARAAGVLNFSANREIYGHSSVKRALSRMQSNRCAYCETYVKPAQPGHVDHFRPCGAVKQNDGAPRLVPGYFWLAYRWDNLVLACLRCNTSHKRDLFPLRQPHQRARVPGQEDETAGPLFIHPITDEPRDHLRYREAAAYPVNGSDKGLIMRDMFRLNRDRMLLGHRREYLETFKNSARVAESHPAPQTRRRAETLVGRLLAGEGQYLAMIRDAFRAMVASGEIMRLAVLCPP